MYAENNLISPKQLGFKPDDSCINQLLSITYEIYKSFDDGLEVRRIFFDISEAQDGNKMVFLENSLISSPMF